MNRQEIRTINGIIMVSSKEVAKVVGIQNSHVVEHIDEWIEENKFHWGSESVKELFVLALPEHPINGRKCKAYWVSRNGIKHLKAQHDRYNKARDLYFELLNMELGRTSDNTFETTGLNNTTTLVHRPMPLGDVVEYNPVDGTLAIISEDEREVLAGRPIEDDLKNENGQIVVSSRMVAERFGKQHKHVLDSIENITAENSALINNYFIPSTYTAGTGKSYKEYLMTRDGFTLLAMGFTGKEALKFKLAYIEAFNKMEKALKNQSPALPVTYKDALIALVAEIDAKEKLEIEVKAKDEVIQAKEEVIQDLKPKSEYCERILKSKGTVTTTFIAKDYGMSAATLNDF